MLQTRAERLLLELDHIIAGHPEVRRVGTFVESGESLGVVIDIDTQEFTHRPGGLPARDIERFLISLPPGYPLIPPDVVVNHDEWAGRPHMIGASALCLFLDPARSWHPEGGLALTLNRLWGWLEEAIGAAFDPKTSLFHGLGGASHRTPADGRLLLVRQLPPGCAPGVHDLVLRSRTDYRIDIVDWNRPIEAGETPGLLIALNRPLSRGVGTTLQGLLDHLDVTPRLRVLNGEGTPQWPSGGLVAHRIARLRRRLPVGQELVVVVAGRNPSLAGDDALDLAAFRLSTADIPSDIVQLPRARGAAMTPLSFLHVDDCRPGMTQRRDTGRPTEWYRGKAIELWGCGALGSWMAELLVRAGVASMTIRDYGTVTRDLLTRQNFIEASLGSNKAVDLASRLRGISSDVAIHAPVSSATAGLSEGWPACDLLIDATVNVGVTGALNAAWSTNQKGPPVVQVATDTSTATLGALTFATPGGPSPGDVDRVMRSAAQTTAALEPFTPLWDDDPADLFSPTRGCSTPTFRGSAADAMGIAAAGISLLGLLAAAPAAGGYLFALPYSPTSAPPVTWLAA